jgi:hypothetical protein
MIPELTGDYYCPTKPGEQGIEDALSESEKLMTTAPHIQPVTPVAVSTISPVLASQSDNAGDQNANENMASGVSAGKLGLSPVYSDC